MCGLEAAQSQWARTLSPTSQCGLKHAVARQAGSPETPLLTGGSLSPPEAGYMCLNAGMSE